MTPSPSFHTFDSTMCVQSPGSETGKADRATYDRLKRALRAKGFRFVRDPWTVERFPMLARDHHLGEIATPAGSLFVLCEIYPVGCKLEFFQEVVRENRYGGRYDFNRVAKMPYLIRKKFEGAMATLRMALVKHGFVDTSSIESPVDARPIAERLLVSEGEGTAATPEAISAAALRYFNGRWNGDYEKRRGINRFERDDTGWPAASQIAYGRHDRDGVELLHGDVRYFRDHKGYLVRGRVYGGINGMWTVIYGPGARDHTHLSSGSLFTCDPRKAPRKEHPRPQRLEAVLERCVKQQKFERAIILRDLLKSRTAADDRKAA
jgi:hypothetical protein